MVTLETTRLKRLLDTAAKEFAAFGYKGASLNRILARANVSKGVAYYHFKDKTDLFTAVLRAYWEQLMAEMEFDAAQLTQANYWDESLELFRRTTNVTLQAPWMQGVMQAVATMPREMRTRGPVGRLMEDYRARLEALVARGQELGLVRADVRQDFLLEMLLTLNQGMERWLSLDVKGADAEEHLESYVDMVRRVLEPNGKPARKAAPAKAPAKKAPAKKTAARRAR